MNLIELARSYLTPEVIDKASALVGETPTATRRSLETAIPAVVAGVAGEGASPSGARRLMGILEEAGLLGPMASTAERLSAGSGEDLVTLGKDLLGKLFGARLGVVTDTAASAAGVKTSSMASLLGLAGPNVAVDEGVGRRQQRRRGGGGGLHRHLGGGVDARAGSGGRLGRGGRRLSG